VSDSAVAAAVPVAVAESAAFAALSFSWASAIAAPANKVRNTACEIIMFVTDFIVIAKNAVNLLVIYICSIASQPVRRQRCYTHVKSWYNLGRY
jgi:hypothetical protein